MKNLNTLNVQELSIQESKEIHGGGRIWDAVRAVGEFVLVSILIGAEWLQEQLKP